MDVNEQKLISYLLGELPEAEQSALEAAYFADPRVFDQIVATENKLVDDYARGRLPAELRARLERSYLTDPARRERVNFAVALAARLEQTKAVETRTETTAWWQGLFTGLRGLTPAMRYSFALVVLIAVLFGAWLLFANWRRQREAGQIQANAAQRQRERDLAAENERKRAEEIAAGKDTDKEPPPPAPVPTPTPTPSSQPRSVTLALTFGGVRGGGGSTPTLVVPAETTQVRLVLAMSDSEYPTYRAVLESTAGGQVFSQTKVKPARSKGGATFVFTVPARKLPPGEYILKLSGVDPNGEVDDLSRSLFRVVGR